MAEEEKGAPEAPDATGGPAEAGGEAGGRGVPTGEDRHSVGQRILKATVAIVFIQVILRGFGLIEKMVLGRLFPVDGLMAFKADAYNAAKDIAFYVFSFVDQVVMHSFLPVFVARMKEKGEKDAWRLASTIGNGVLVGMTLVAGLGILFAPQVLHFFMGGWFREESGVNPELIPLTVSMMRLILVAVIFMATSSLTYCLLNSYKQFALPASADLVLKGSVLVFALLLAKSELGPKALAIGFVVGAVGKLLVHLIGLGPRMRNYRPTLHMTDPGVKQFAWLALPLVVGAVVSIIRNAADNRFASELETGSLSALRFARTLCDTPVGFFSFAFGVALFPFLADVAAAGNKQRLREMLMTATRMMILIFLPLSAVIIALRVPIVVAVFGSGNMRTADPLWVYAMWMLFGALEIVVLQFFFAMRNTVIPAATGILMVPFHIAATWYGIHVLQWGALAIAGALFFSKGTKVVILYALVRKRVDSLEGKRTLAFVGKIALALLPLLAVLYGASLVLPAPQFAEGSKLGMAINLSKHAAAGVVALGAYAVALHFLGVDELRVLVSRIVGKMRKR